MVSGIEEHPGTMRTYRRSRNRFGRGFARGRKNRRRQRIGRFEENYKDFVQDNCQDAGAVSSTTMRCAVYNTSDTLSGFTYVPAAVAFVSNVLSIPGGYDSCALTHISQGDATENRTGRKIFISKIHFSQNLNSQLDRVVTTSTANDPNEQVLNAKPYNSITWHFCLIRHVASQGTIPDPSKIYLPYSTGGGITPASDVWHGISMLRDRRYTSSYEVIKHWKRKITLDQVAVSAETASTAGNAQIEKVVKVNRYVQYFPNEADGTVGKTSDGALYLLCWVQNDTAHIYNNSQMRVRVYFYDV